ncbi:MAG: hypothetical protein WCV55_02355 [Candidatus Paceibacterota bacterium]
MSIDILARHLVSMEERLSTQMYKIEDKLSTRIDDVKLEIKKVNFKIDSLSFNHERRIEVLEDGVIKIKTLVQKK